MQVATIEFVYRQNSKNILLDIISSFEDGIPFEKFALYYTVIGSIYKMYEAFAESPVCITLSISSTY